MGCFHDSPSSVACGATFPLEGEGFYTFCESQREHFKL